MNFKLVQAAEKDKAVLNNLLQFYMYDFSEYINCDVEVDGLFKAYPGLEAYWQIDNKYPYIIMKDEKYIGFVLVKFIESAARNYFSIAEFFIMKKYRRVGIGKAAATQVFNLHKGQWEVFQKENNTPARLFWNRVIDEYTKGQFKDRLENGRRIQDFEN